MLEVTVDKLIDKVTAAYELKTSRTGVFVREINDLKNEIEDICKKI